MSGRWMAALRALEIEKAAGDPTDKADKSPFVSSVSIPPERFPEIESDEAQALGDRLVASALAALLVERARVRAVRAEPFADGYILGLALRAPSGLIATAVLQVPASDGFRLLDAFQGVGEALR